MCEAEGVLCDSHISPKWAYVTALNGGNRLVQVANGEASYSEKQRCEYMLCQACEGRFRDPENYVAPLVSKPNGAFRAWAPSIQT